jgi:Ca2+/Na+ antiporter
MLLSVLPDLVVVFLFYKRDTFKIAVGCMVGAVIYIIAASFML